LPLAPKHWQIHHLHLIGLFPGDLIPEIGVALREKSDSWTPRPKRRPKTD
jgi:hypothetical protein